MDRAPLREPEFAKLWWAMLITRIGTGMVFVAVPFQIQELTDDPLAVGLLGAVGLIPTLATGLLGGALADAIDRRTLILAGEGLFVVAAVALYLNARSTSPQLWLIYVVAATHASGAGIQRPAAESIFKQVIRYEHVSAAATLNSFRSSVSYLFGLLLGGILITHFGVSGAFFVDALTCIPALVLFAMLRTRRTTDGIHNPVFDSIRFGISYARTRPELIGTYALDTVAMVFGLPVALLPAFSKQFGGAGALSYLAAAPFLGSLLASASSRWTAKVHRHGRAIVFAAMLWGVGIMFMGLSRNLWLAVVCFAFAGAADMISGVFRMTIWNQTIPDELRGRLAGIELISYSAGPLLGDLESGVAARFISVRGAIVSGGVACSVGCAGLGRAMRQFWFYDDRTNPAATAERQRQLGARVRAPDGV